ncbi:MAG: hypothetical protein HYY40_12235 [Bacteroidetes bacterium]|nr:hypothetical protein [Bacteroidota bacterium]
MIATPSDLDSRWDRLTGKLSGKFNRTPDLNAILFLIGIEESGTRQIKFTKDEKMDLIQLAGCRLLSRYGYFVYDGKTEEGFPKWKSADGIPPLDRDKEETLIKKSILEYFSDLE